MAEEKTEKKEKQDPNSLVAQFQILQQQLQNVLIQKETLNMSIMEMDRAVDFFPVVSHSLYSSTTCVFSHPFGNMGIKNS